MTPAVATASGAGALALRLAAALLLTAAGLFALLAFGITRLDTHSVGGAVRYVLPGTADRSVDPLVVSVLAACACGTGLTGMALSILGRGGPISFRPGVGQRPYAVLIAGLLLLAVALLVRFGL